MEIYSPFQPWHVKTGIKITRIVIIVVIIIVVIVGVIPKGLSGLLPAKPSFCITVTKIYRLYSS